MATSLAEIRAKLQAQQNRGQCGSSTGGDRKSTRLNSSHT